MFAVLNARFHEQEAYIVAKPAPGAITIATNMAGRGTDIKLGGSLDMGSNRRPPISQTRPRRPQVERIKADIALPRDRAEGRGHSRVGPAKGSKPAKTVNARRALHHRLRAESRRIDNQLRGRSGRQGDPGRSKFFLSLEDDLMRTGSTGSILLTRLASKGEPFIPGSTRRWKGAAEGRGAQLRHPQEPAEFTTSRTTSAR